MRIVAVWVMLALVSFVATAEKVTAQKASPEAKALVSKAHAANRAGRKDEALTLFAKAIALKQFRGTDLASLHNSRAVILTDLNRRPEAIEEMALAIAAAPKHPSYYGNRGRIYRTMKMYDKAAADFTRVIELSPKPGAYDYAARCQVYAQMKERAKAIADCEKALALRPGYSRAARELKKLKGGS